MTKPSPAQPDPKPKPGPAPTRAPKPNGLVVRASVEWRETLARAAQHDGRTMAGFLAQAAKTYAKSIGFDEEWPDR